jgi:aminoglycoside 3-N-acetyltransferase
LRDARALTGILRDFGVPRGGALVVHSAIGVLSRRGYRADNMIERLLDLVPDGGLFMPTMTWRTVTPDQPVWDEMATPSHTGVLSEVFRKYYSTARSIHPTHSVAGCGPKAQPVLMRHHLDDTPVSANSPYGLMAVDAAYILLLGVGLESCTAIHLAEETVAPDIYLRPPAQSELYECRDRHGWVHRVRMRRHRRLDRDFPRFAASLEAKGRLKTGTLEGCRFTILALPDLLDVVFAALADDPHATLRGVPAHPR